MHVHGRVSAGLPCSCMPSEARGCCVPIWTCPLCQRTCSGAASAAGASSAVVSVGVSTSAATSTAAAVCSSSDILVAGLRGNCYGPPVAPRVCTTPAVPRDARAAPLRRVVAAPAPEWDNSAAHPRVAVRCSVPSRCPRGGVTLESRITDCAPLVLHWWCYLEASQTAGGGCLHPQHG